jgi:hypothetical protein
MLKTLADIRPIPDFVKEASIIDKESIPSKFFALPEKRAYSFADPASTYVSFGYWLMNKNGLSGSENQRVKTNLVKAAEFFGITDEILDLARNYQGAKRKFMEKHAEENYGLPKEKAYPLHTPAHVTSAIEHFPEHHTNWEIPERMAIARKIIKKANEFGMPIQAEIIVSYGTAEPVCRSDRAAANIAARALHIEDLSGQRLFNKLAHSMVGNMVEQEVLFKLAGVLETLDSHFGLNGHYGKRLQNPIETVFNVTGKEAAEILQHRPINLAGEEYDLSELARVSLDTWEEMLGKDFVDSITGEAGTVDPNKLVDILPTLPLPEKNIINRYLKQYFSSTKE